MDSQSDISLSDDEPITALSVLNSLEEAWLNEKFCPEILPHQSDLVDCMLQQIRQMEENISKLRKGDFRIIIHRMELERIRYIITSYLRNRLEKIETYTAHILDEESRRAEDDRYLSPGEYKFANEYLKIIQNHFHLLALRHMPSNFQGLAKNKMMIQPNLHSYIFLQAKRSINGVVVENDTDNRDEEVDLDEGAQHIIQYYPIADFVKSGAVQLI